MDDILILAEHENPEKAIVLVFDDHYKHIQAHAKTRDPRLLSHIEEHIKLLKDSDPAILAIRHEDIIKARMDV